MKHLFYILSDWKTWAYWGEDNGIDSEQFIAESINKILDTGELPDYVKVIQVDRNNTPIHFRVGRIEIKRVSQSAISMFNGWYDEQIEDGSCSENRKEDYWNLFLDNKLGISPF